MKILALDTSCDDTSASVVANTTILSNIVSSQISLHQPYGGVYPTVAKLAHQQNVAPVTTLALKRAHLVFSDLDALGVTIGPGLAPALEIGINYARSLAQTHHLPLVAVNHLEGHLLSPLLRRHSLHQDIPSLPKSFPYPHTLGLIVSGGHSQFVAINDFGDYLTLGETLDDAAGEALDKIGRLLGLGYPAAPVMEELAKSGDSTLYPFPLPLTARHDANLSFSGLKTHAHHLITSLQQDHQLTRQDICNLAASAQAGVFRHLTYKLDRLLQPHPETASFTHLFLGGGVAANNYLRILLRQLGKKHHYTLHVPVSKRLCGDNAAMIALVAALKARAQLFASLDTVDRQPNLQLSSWDANK